MLLEDSGRNLLPLEPSAFRRLARFRVCGVADADLDLLGFHALGTAPFDDHIFPRGTAFELTTEGEGLGRRVFGRGTAGRNGKRGKSNEDQTFHLRLLSRDHELRLSKSYTKITLLSRALEACR